MSSASTAHPAHPILASTLYDIYLASSTPATTTDTNTTHTEYEPPHKRRRLCTGLKVLDRDVLHGGLVYGEGGLVCLSVGAEGGGGAGGAGGGSSGGSGEKSGGVGEDVGEEFAYSTLASHLLSTSTLSTSSPKPATTTTSSTSTSPSPTNPAFLIDPLGTFSPSRLHSLLCSRLRTPEFTHQGGYVYSTTNTARSGPAAGSTANRHGEEISKVAATLLDRVRIMRVFDFSGVMECVGEIGAVLRSMEEDEEGEEDGGIADVEGGGVNSGVGSGNWIGEKERGSPDVPAGAPGSGKPAQKQATDRHEIADSQADDFLSSADEDDDSNNTRHAAISPASHSAPKSLPMSTSTAHPLTSIQPPLGKPDPPLTTQPHALILLPYLPRLLSPLMHHNHVRGHALLIHLLRSLRHLTSAHAVCIVLLNGVVGVPVPLPVPVPGLSVACNGVSGGPGNNNEDEDEEAIHKLHTRGFERERPQSRNTTTSSNATGETDSVSIFASNGALRPALGKAFAWGVDVSLMVSVVGNRGEAGGGVRVIEVVSDRFEGRAGRWCELG